MKTELRQKCRLIVCLLVAMIAVVPAAQAQFTINNGSSLGTWSVGLFEIGLSTSNGIGPYTWTLESGALPPGMSIRTDLPSFFQGGQSTAVLAGIATTPGTYNFTIGVTDSTGSPQHTSKAFSLKISSLVVKDWFNLPDSFLTVPYSHTLTAMRDGVPVTGTWSGTGYSSSVTITQAAPGVVTWTNHGLANGEKVTFQNNSGTLPTPLSSATVYYVRNRTTNTFEITTTPGGGGSSIATTSADLGGNNALAMPPGLTLNSATGEISGTPTRAGFYNFQINVTEGSENIGRGNLNLSVYAVDITTAGSLPNATQNAIYSTAIVATGGGGMVFTASGLPGGNGGLSLDSSGILSSGGNPVTLSPGLYSFNVTATTGGVSYSRRMSVNVVGVPAALPRIEPYQGAFTDCQVGVPCSVGVSVLSGGTAPFTWSQSGLPAGLTIRTAGRPDTTANFTPEDAEIFGSATVAGSYPVTITVTDSSVPATTATNTFTLKVSELSMSGNTNVTWTRGTLTTQVHRIIGGPSVPAAFAPAPDGGTLYTATLINGTPPAGVSLQAGPPLYSGTPTENGQFSTRLRFTNTTSGKQLESSYFFSVGGGTSTIQINTGGNLGTVFNGASYSNQLSACCTPNSINWTVGAGMPTGLSLSGTGVLSASAGAMTTPGTYTFLVTATDSGNGANFGTRLFTMFVTANSITNPSNTLPTGNVGTVYGPGGAGVQLTSTIGGGTWSLIPFNYMPPGLGLSAGGLISGTPTQSGQYSFTTLVNSAGSVSARTFTIAIYPNGAFPPVNLSFGPNFGPFAVGVVSISISNTAASGGTGSGYVYSWSPSATPVPGMRIQNGAPFPTNGFSGAAAGIMGVVATPGIYSTSIRVTDSSGTNFFDRAIVITVSPLTILTPSGTGGLPNGTKNVAYTPMTLVPYGLGPNYTWALTNNPPAGITIGASTGVLSGTPTVSGSFNFNVTLTDNGTGKSISIGHSMTVDGFAITTPGLLPEGTVGVFYTQTFDGSGCTGTCGWSISGNTPGGMNFNTGTGVLSGTPTGTFSNVLNITRTSSGGGANGPVTKGFSLQIKNALPQTLVITTASTFYSTVGSGGTLLLGASGGANGAYTWTLDSGTLPPGVSLSQSLITPGISVLGPRAMEVGTYNFVMKVTDSSAAFVTKAFTWKVVAVNESYTSLPLGGGSLALNSPFSQQLLGLGGTGVSGTGSYLWANTTPLPYGLALDPNSGVLSGTPLEQPSSSSFPIQLTDTVSSATIISNVNINIATPSGTLNWATNASLGTFNQGATLNSTLFNPASAGGTAPYTVTALTALPAGFALLSGDALVAVGGTNQPIGSTVLSGVPMTPGTYSFTLRVQDSAGTPLVRVRTFTFSVAAFTFGVGNTFPNAAVGEPYSQTLKTWSAGAVTWAPSANSSLPPGLGVAAGVLSGTPTQAGSFTFNLDGTDASGVVRTGQFSLTVASIRITSALVLPVATVGVPYNYDFDVASGAVTWTLGSTLPDGLDFDFNTGVISGTPQSTGTFGLNVGATPTGGGTAEVRRFVLYVRFPNPSVLDVGLAGTVLTDATVNQVVSYALANSGGVAPYTWTVAGGSTLPTGLMLITADSLGSVPPNLTTIGGVNTTTNPGMTLLAGVPTVAGDYAFDLIVTDTTVPTPMAARRTFTLHVSPLGAVAGTPRTVTAGVAYSQQFTVFGGTPPYTFTTTAINSRQDMLPPGLNMSSSTGLLAGTTTSTGSYIFNLVIADNAAHTFSRRYTLTSANANGLYVSNTNPPDVSLGLARGTFDPQVQMTNFNSPPQVAWSVVSGALPPGVSLINGAPFSDDDEYSVAGQPTTAGTYNFTLRATQVGLPSNTADHAFTWRIVPMQIVTPPTIGTIATDLPPAQVGVFYTTTIKMAGGTPPYTFAPSPLVPMPAGMSLSSAGVLSGTPTSIGTSTIFPVVTDSAGSPNVLRAQAIAFVVTPAATPAPLTFVTDLDVPDLTIGAPFDFPLDVLLRGGTPPFTWTVQGGSSLPPGLALLPGVNGVSTYLGGVPSSFPLTPPPHDFYLEAHDSAGQTTPVRLHNDYTQLSITPESLPTGVVGVPYPATQFTAAGGTGPYQILVYPGADFPAGLTLSPTGLLQGTPTAAGNFAVFIVALDSTGNAFGDRLFLMAVDNSAGEAPAVSLSPAPIQLMHTTGTSDPAPTPVSINAASGTFPYGLSIAGIPGAAVSTATGTAPDASNSILWTLSSVGVGTYHGILGVRASSTNLLNQVPVTLTVLAPCSYGVNPTSGSAPAAGGFGSFSVTAASDCAWTATPVSSPWVTITSATSGSGPANITYTVAANGGASARVGTIDVNGAIYSITQFGTGCATSISPSSLSATAAGGTAVVNVTASGPACTWTASSADYGLSAAGGTGSGSITVTVPSNVNSGGVVLNGTIAGQAFTVNQTGVGCSVGLSSSVASATADGGSASVFVTTPGGCSYDTLVGPSWVNVTSGAAGGSGITELVYSVQPSSGTVERSGTLTIGGQPFQITQAGVACSVTVDTSQLGSPYGPAAGFVVGTIGVMANGPNCAWSADSGQPWVTIAPSSGVGSGTINVSVTSNAAVTSSRSADLTVAGQTVSVSQAGTTCTYGLQSSAGSVPAAGSLGTFGVVAPSVCSWSAASDNLPWLSVVSAGSGGTSNVLLSVTANATAVQRVGTITVSSTDVNTPLVTKVYTVTQAPAACSYSLTASSAGPLTFDPSSGSVGFAPLNGCAAPTPVSYASWVTNVAVAGSDVTYDVLANPSPAVRAGSIQIGDKTFAITQQGNTCGFSLNAYGATFSQPGGSGSVLASSTSIACPTNPATDHPLFIHLGTLSGDATLYTQPFTVDPYNSLNINVRFGTITFGGRIFSVKQLSW